MSLKQQRLEHCINELIRMDGKCYVHFKYCECSKPDNDSSDSSSSGSGSGSDDWVRLDALTYNPTHDTSFLLWCGINKNIITVLENLFQYLQKPSYTLTYEFTWKKTDNDTLRKSHFVGDTTFDTVKKFFYDKNNHNYKIIEMKLM
jgi:hypothetical protein